MQSLEYYNMERFASDGAEECETDELEQNPLDFTPRAGRNTTQSAQTSISKHLSMNTDISNSATGKNFEISNKECSDDELSEFERIERAVRAETLENSLEPKDNKRITEANDESHGVYSRIDFAVNTLKNHEGRFLNSAKREKNAVDPSLDIETKEQQGIEGDPPISSLVQRMFKIEKKHEDAQMKTSVQIEAKNDASEKMHELQSEILKYRKASQDLANQKQLVQETMKSFEKVQKEMKIQHSEFMRTQTQKRQDFSSWLKAEREKLQKERNKLDRQKQLLKLKSNGNIIDRKERSRIEVLETTIMELRKEKNEIIEKNKNALAAKDKRIGDLVSQVAELECALRLAEERRIDAWDEQHRCEAKLEEANHTLQELQASFSSLERKLQEEQRLRDPPKQEKQVNAKTQYEDPGVKSEISQLIEYENGTKKEIYENGVIRIRFFNGDISTEYVDGTCVYYYKSANVTQTTYPNNSEEFRFPDGTIRTKNHSVNSEYSEN